MDEKVWVEWSKVSIKKQATDYSKQLTGDVKEFP